MLKQYTNLGAGIMEHCHVAAWIILLFVANAAKTLGNRLMDFGWWLGDYAADKHYRKTKEGTRVIRALRDT